MNELEIRRVNLVTISDSTKELIQAGVSENTLKAYRRALVNLKARMNEDDFSLSRVSRFFNFNSAHNEGFMKYRKEVFCAVIGGVVGTVLTMVAGSFSPLGAQDEAVDLNVGEITCKGLKVVDADGSPLAEIDIDGHGGHVIVVGKDPVSAAAMRIDGHGGIVNVVGKGPKLNELAPE